MIVPFLFQILVVGLLGYAIVRFARGRAGEDDSGATLRRLFEYALLAALVVIAGVGVTGLLERVLAGADELVRRDESALATSLAFVLVGTPALAWLGRRVHRRLTADPQERASFAWAAYLTIVQSGALLTAMFALARTIRWAIGDADYDAAALATAVVWSLVWAGHWLAASRLGWPARLELRDLFGSAAGLIGAAAAAGYGLGWLLAAMYDELFRQVVVAPGGELRAAAAWLLVAAPVWWWHWARSTRHADVTGPWRAYVLLLGVLGGVLVSLGALGTMLFLAAQWLVGDPGIATAADHFAPVAGALAALAAGGGVWAYHRAVLTPLRRDRSEVDRIYNYLLAAVGLGAAAGGVATMIAAAIDAVLPASRVVVDTAAGDVLAAALTLLAIGLPVWLRQWRTAQRHAGAAAAAERSSRIRRAYLFTTVGIGAVAALASLLVVLITTFEDALEGTLTVETLRDVEVALAVLATAGAVVGGHTRELRTDRELAPPPAKPAVHDVLLVTGDGAELAAALARELGVPVRSWRRLDGNGAARPVPVDEVVAAVRASPHEHLVVLTTPAGTYELVPVDPARG